MRFMSIVCFLVATIFVCAQDKKDPKVAKGPAPKLVTDDLTKAGPDFAIQGEYEDANYDQYKIGAQVIARGDGNFVVRMLKGGLPGAGWDGETQQLLAAKTTDGKVIVTGKDPSGGNVLGTIENGQLTLKGEGFILKRVERESPTLGEKPPAGALVLFEKPEDIKRWKDARIAELPDGKFLAAADKNAFGKDIGRYKMFFYRYKNFKLHLEFRLAFMPSENVQARSVSGVCLQNRYELRIVDSFGLKGENNECGSFNLQRAPLVNMCLPPLTWQTYDVDFKAVEFDKDGNRTQPARATVKLNGVLVHDNVELKGPTVGGLKEDDNPAPLRLTYRNGCPVVFRNIWMVEAK